MPYYEPKLYKVSKFFPPFLVIVCEIFLELDGLKAPDDLSSYAVRFGMKTMQFSWKNIISEKPK